MRLLSALLIFVISASMPLAGPAHTVDPQSTSANAAMRQINQDVGKLVSEFYPKAKITSDGFKIHFEYKAHPYLGVYSNREELSPDNGGILGDLELKPGEYSGSEKLPKEQNQYSYTQLLMAPFSKQHNCHLYTRISYPPDMLTDFLDHMKEIVNNFDNTLVVGKDPIFTAIVQTPAPVATQAPPRPVAAAAAVSHATPAQPAVPAVSQPLPLPAVPNAATKPGSTTIASATLSQPLPLPAVPDAATKPGSTAAAAATPATPEHKLFLWKATRGKDIVYLLGTIHVATPKLYPMPIEVDEAFDRSKLLIVEIAIDRRPVDANMVQQLVKNCGTYTLPDKLSNHMSPGTRKVFEDYLKWSGESWKMYEQYKPWYVTELTTASIPMRSEEMSKVRSSLGIDRYLLGRAKATHKPVADLETIDFQLRLSSNLSEDVQDKLLQVTLLGVKDSPTILNDSFTAWRNGDAAKMNAVVTKIVREHPDLAPYNKILLDNRNATMASTLEELMKTKPGPYFVAVGSGHMVGDTGLVVQLKKRGFTVEQVCSDSHAAATVTSEGTEHLKKFVFPDERFKLWMPGSPQRKELPGGEPHGVQYMFAEFGGTAGAKFSTTFGMFTVFCFEFPADPSSWKVPGPLALDMMLAPVTAAKGSETVSRRSIMLNGKYAGREVGFIAPLNSSAEKATGKGEHNSAKPKPVATESTVSGIPGDLFSAAGTMSKSTKLYGRARAYLVENRIYMLIAAGDSDTWSKSESVSNFLNSFEVMP